MGPGKGVNANRLAKVGLGEGSLDLGLCLVGGPISMPPKPLGDTGRIVATLISVAERVRERNKDLPRECTALVHSRRPVDGSDPH